MARVIAKQPEGHIHVWTGVNQVASNPYWAQLIPGDGDSVPLKS